MERSDKKYSITPFGFIEHDGYWQKYNLTPTLSERGEENSVCGRRHSRAGAFSPAWKSPRGNESVNRFTKAEADDRGSNQGNVRNPFVRSAS